ncbi:MAG: hypothetical protein ACI86M_000621, partial [Saprospiraceae bacterium]
WAYKHIVEKVYEENSMRIDDITFITASFILSLIMFPTIFLGFYPLKKISSVL